MALARRPAFPGLGASSRTHSCLQPTRLMPLCRHRRPAIVAVRAAATSTSASASSSASALNPLGDVAFKIPGAGRLASKAAESISNPKESKQQQRKKQQQEQREKREQQQREAEQEQEEEAAAAQEEEAAAAAALLDPLEQLEAAAGAAAEDAAAAVEGAAAAVRAEAGAAADAAAAALAPEAHAAAGTAAAALKQQQQQRRRQQQQQEALSEFTEEELPAPKTLQQRAADARVFLTATRTGKGVTAAAALFLGATFAIALYRSWQKYSSPRAQRKRVVDRNRALVDGLAAYLPDKRAELTPAVANRLRAAAGFTPVEAFRKYLWFLLRERQFGPDAVADLVALKAALNLTDDDVAEALRERASRVYDKYGTLMLNVEGMTPQGVERKAACRALFAKLLFLTEHEPLLARGSEDNPFRAADLHAIFGATDEDVERMRIVSFVDVDKLEQLFGGGGGGSGGASGGGSGSDDEQQQQQAQQQQQQPPPAGPQPGAS